MAKILDLNLGELRTFDNSTALGLSVLTFLTGKKGRLEVEAVKKGISWLMRSKHFT